jgi:hypothetical protein
MAVAVLMAVCVGETEVRVVRATSAVGRMQTPDIVFDRGTLTVREALKVVRLMTSLADVPSWENH